MKLCCPGSEFYSLESHKCEEMPQHVNITWVKKLKLSARYFKELNVLDSFEFEVKTPCEKPKRIEEDGDYDILDVQVSYNCELLF